MKLSQAGEDLIFKHEGVRQKLYDDRTGKTIAKASDATGFPTIGVGHLVKASENFDGVTISMEEVRALFEKDVAWAEKLINELGVELNQNQFDALVSFVYNVGPGKKGVKDGLITLRNGNPSSILRNLRAGRYQEAADGLLSWTRSGGVVLPGLVKRRQDERALFLR